MECNIVQSASLLQSELAVFLWKFTENEFRWMKETLVANIFFISLILCVKIERMNELMMNE
jgi:hypothetical protein